MSVPRGVGEAVAGRSGVVIVVVVVATVVAGAGMPMVGADVELEEITGESPEAQANEYVEENFTTAGEPNTTAVLIVHTGPNTLTRESVLRSLRLQERIRANRSINRTLIEDDPITGLENVIAIAALRSQQVDALEERADELQARSDELNETEDRLAAGLDEIRALQRAFEADTAGVEENSSAYRQREARLEADIDAVVRSATRGLEESERSSYRGYADAIRRFESQLVALEREYGEEAAERTRYGEIERKIRDNYQPATGGMIEQEFFQLISDFRELESDFEALEDADRPPLEAQVAAVRDGNLTRSEYRAAVREALNGTGPRSSDVLRLVSSSYRVDSARASARLTVVTQRTSGKDGLEMGVTNETLIAAQSDLRALVASYGAGEAPNATGENASAGTGRERRTIVFGSGLVEEEIDRSMGDTLAIVTPLAFLLVVIALAVAYRDLLDILLGLVGITTVLVWTFGLMGWLGIPFNVLLVAVPVLLIGIAIDFAVHVLMRHREHRTPDAGVSASGTEPAENATGVRPAMATAIAGVGIALFWAAATTVIGFFANLVSPLSLIRQFGLASGFGIASALAVFTTLVPALKIELDERLERLGLDRRKRAFGTTGRLSGVLVAGETIARRAPVVVLAVLVVVTAISGVAALGVTTTFQQEDFIAHDPPEWTDSLPGPMAPGEYHTAADLEVVNEHFRPADAEAQILVRGDVNTTAAFERVVRARQTAADTPRVYTLPNGRADIQDPLSVMRTVAADNDSFNETFRAADVDGDAVPERDIPGLYDALFRADPGAASQVIYRTRGGEYAAVRLIVGVQGEASYAQTTTAMRAVAATIEQGTGPVAGVTTAGTETADLTAIATGQSVVNRVIERALFETLTRSFVVTLVAVFLVMTIGYRLAGHGATLGAVTVVPVLLSVAWILGTMAVLDIPFNVLTVTITSLTIGLGVSYSIHVSARYRLELDRRTNAWEALRRTLTGTGGALLGSVATTTAAFGTLALAILPVLAQFGLITAITIVYAFLASVLALPTLLVLWTKYAGPDVSLRPPGGDGHGGGGDAGAGRAESD